MSKVVQVKTTWCYEVSLVFNGTRVAGPPVPRAIYRPEILRVGKEGILGNGAGGAHLPRLSHRQLPLHTEMHTDGDSCT